MKITLSTTLSELQIGLAKLGVDSMVWSSFGADQHAVTLVMGEQRFVGFGVLMTDALNHALNQIVQSLGADNAIALRPTPDLNRSRMLRAEGICGVYKTATVNDPVHGYCTLSIGHGGDHEPNTRPVK